jgi:hypothetical protein
VCWGETYTQQGRAYIRRLHPDWAARPALMSRAAHAVESKAVVRIEVAVSPRPCLGCAVELVLRVALIVWGGKQGRAYSRRLHPDEAAPPALMRRAAHAVESNAVVRIEVPVSPPPKPLPGLRYPPPPPLRGRSRAVATPPRGQMAARCMSWAPSRGLALWLRGLRGGCSVRTPTSSTRYGKTHGIPGSVCFP